jgi:hypothetical protein
MRRRILHWSARSVGLLALGGLTSGVFAGCSDEDKGSEVTPSGGAAGASGAAGAGAIGVDSGGGSAGASGAGGGDAQADTALPRCPSLEQLSRCGTQGAQAQIKIANILLVIDKSGSMNDTPTGFPSSKWLALKSALAQALPPVADDVNFGLLLYPFSPTVTTIPGDCDVAECCQVPEGAGAIRVPVAVGTTSISQVTDALNATAPGGGTPTAAALARAYEYFTTGAGASLEGEKYVMLATDGGPNCNTAPRTCDACHCTTNLDQPANCATASSVCNESQLPYLCLDDQSVLTEVTKLKNANIPTFVIGIPGTEAYADFLDPIADAGGKAVTGQPRRFYQVSAQGGVQGLVDVFRDITTQLVRSCEIPLGKNPPDLNKVNVALDCELVPQNPNDAGNNWRIDTSTDPNKLIFEGQTCNYIQMRGANRVDVVYGCPPIN